MKWIKEIIRQRKRGNYKIFTLREKLSFAYVFFGLSAFSLVVYASTHGELDLAEYHGLKTDEDRVTTSGKRRQSLDFRFIFKDRNKYIEIICLFF